MVLKLSELFKGYTEGIAFDVDGTIVNTPPSQFDWFKHWANQNNIKFKFKGMKLREWLDTIYNPAIFEGGFPEVYKVHGLPDDSSLGRENAKVWKAYDSFKKENQHKIKIYEGMDKVFRELHNSGKIPKDGSRDHALSLGIVTTNTWAPYYDIMDAAGIIERLTTKVSVESLEGYDANGVGKNLVKPGKIGMDIIMNRWGTNGNSTVYIGDTITDLRACVDVLRNGDPIKKESLKIIGAAWGYDGRTQLSKGFKDKDGQQYHFDAILDNPLEIIDFYNTYLK